MRNRQTRDRGNRTVGVEADEFVGLYSVERRLEARKPGPTNRSAERSTT
jgi:hypothetical protein